jgi:SAM-dependent methyltransferase
VLLIQTPCYVEGTTYEGMVEHKNAFLEQLKHEQHLYLFSQTSIRELFRRLGAEHLAFEPAMFAHYDQFFVVGRAALAEHSPDEIARALTTTPSARMVLALLDLDGSKRDVGRRLSEAETDRAERLKVIQRLGRELAAAEVDRAARLEVIRAQSKEIGRIPGLEAQLAASESGRAASEADRAARLAVILQLEERLKQREQELNVLQSQKLVRLLKRVKLIRSAPPAQPASSFDLLYKAVREPKKPVGIGYNPTIIEHIVSGLQTHGYSVEDYAIDVAGYRDYYARAEYDQKYPNYYRPVIWEKSLEHYIAAKLLALQPGDVYIDIASEGSPVPEIYQRLFGSDTYRQDMIYPAGLNDHMIGGDAGDMPVPDGFASKMALHCSFEHFEGDSDMRFMRELGRVLRPGGAVCIVPFYLFDRYAILTDPEISVPQKVQFESDATVYCRRGWNNRHGRFYDPDHVVTRLLSNLNGLDMKIYKITNAKEVDPRCYVEFAAVIAKPADKG